MTKKWTKPMTVAVLVEARAKGSEITPMLSSVLLITPFLPSTSSHE